jgi:hypothetical protein
MQSLGHVVPRECGLASSWLFDILNRIVALASSFRGASETSEPGIHNPRPWLWIPGPSLRDVPE